MGTKSHTSKALPASIITKKDWLDGVSLGHIQKWMCLFKLSWPFPLCFHHKKKQNPTLPKFCRIQSDAEEIFRLSGCRWCCSSLLLHIESLQIWLSCFICIQMAPALLSLICLRFSFPLYSLCALICPCFSTGPTRCG